MNIDRDKLANKLLKIYQYSQEKHYRDFCIKIQNKYLIKDIEEFSELIKEISKILFGEGNIDNLIEEYADCVTAMAHIKKVFKIKDEDVKKIHKKKGVYKKYD